MKKTLIYLFLFLAFRIVGFGAIVKYDNGTPSGIVYTSQRVGWEESVLLVPAGPCKVNKVLIYYSGNKACKDTLYFCGFPTAGNLYPTEYIWDYNTLIEPVVVDYDGVEGWKEFDISQYGLKSDGIDKIVVQHKLKTTGPFFTFDSDGRQGPLSWYSDPFTPNPNFYNIQGTIHYFPQGDYLIQLDVTYLYPEGDGSLPAPQPKFVVQPINSGGEISVADINNDGWDDFVCGGNVFINTYESNGNYTALPTGISAAGTNWADIDNDGDLDCYAFSNGQFDWDKRMVLNNDKIYRNNGDGTFTALNNSDVFKKPYPNPSIDFNLPTKFDNNDYFNPYNTCTPFWLDYNNDGLPDLYIANKRIEISGKPEIYCPDEIWINNGDGTFSNTRKTANLDSGEPLILGSPADGTIDGYYDCYGAAACDYNNDNLPDIFVATYRLAPDNLYKNLGNGQFIDVGKETGVRGVPTYADNYFGHGMGCSFGDFNNDGYIDLCVGNLAHTDSRGLFSNPSLIFKNLGPDSSFKFQEVHKQMGLKFHEGNAGACWADFDNDGYLDLWHGKYSGGFGTFYLNQGPPDYKLQDITWDVNCFIDSPWEGVRLDFDNDGDIDMIIKNNLVRNDLPHKGNWVSFRLRGNPSEKVSMDCFNTKVYVYAGGKQFYQELMGTAAGTHSNQNSLALHFGIGKANLIDSVAIIYSNNHKNTFYHVTPNAFYLVEYMKEPKEMLLATPALQSPLNFSFNLPENITFEWNKCGFAEYYQIQVSETADFSSNVVDKILDSTNLSLTTSLIQSKFYYWRVRAIQGTNNSAWSTSWSFNVGIPKLQPIKLLTPNNNQENLGNNIAFTWNNLVFANLNFNPYVRYIIQLSEKSDFSTIAYENQYVKDTVLNLIGVTKAGTKYYWRVAPVIESNQGDWSEVFSFLTLDLPPQIALVQPANGATDVPVKPQLIWQTSSNATSYWIQISKSITFDTLAFERQNSGVPPINVIPKLSENTKYFWRVAANNNAGRGPWSDVWSFITIAGNSVNDNFKTTPSKNDFLIFPNPSNETITVDIKNYENDKIILSLLDEQGKFISKIFEGNVSPNFDNFVVSTKSFPAGSYFIQLQNVDKKIIKKVIILH
jgi:hypothetical protein